MAATKTAIGLGLLLSMAVFPAIAHASFAQAKSAKIVDPLVENQLRKLFNFADLNKDGFLDAQELAKSFRGAKAKAPPPLQYDDTGMPKPGTGINRKYPDQVFLYAADKDGDGQLSWAEYERYGQDYFAALKGKQLSAQRQQALYLQAQRNYAQSMARRSNYSRYRSNSYGYHRPIRSHTNYSTVHRGYSNTNNAVRIVQAQQNAMVQQQRLMIQQQQRMVAQRMQYQRMVAQRMQAAYTRQVAAMHRVVRTPPHYQRRR